MKKIITIIIAMLFSTVCFAEVNVYEHSTQTKRFGLCHKYSVCADTLDELKPYMDKAKVSFVKDYSEEWKFLPDQAEKKESWTLNITTYTEDDGIVDAYGYIKHVNQNITNNYWYEDFYQIYDQNNEIMKL